MVCSVSLILLVVANNLHDATAASTKRDVDVMPIHFPGPSNAKILDIINKYGTEDVPEKCRNQTFCTLKPPDYPEEHFNKMFKGVKTLPAPSLVIEMTLANRYGNPDEQDDCDSRVTFDPIYRVRPKRESEWMTVVQAPEVGYEQRIRLEICDQPSAPCFNMFPPTPDIKVYCTQKYSKWQMLVAKGTGTEKIEVDLPVCCSCVYKTTPMESRFGTYMEEVTHPRMSIQPTQKH